MREGLFLEASAGTGKTFAIEHLFVRLLLEGEAPPDVDQILVVTFTRAATRELKERLRANLAAAKEALQKGASEWDYLSALIGQGEEERLRAHRRVSEALARFEEAPITTIHGFCHRALLEEAFSAGSSLDVKNPDERSHLPLMREVLTDVLRTKLSLPAFSPGQVRTLLRRCKNDPQTLIEQLSSLLEKGVAIPQILPFSALLDQAQHAIEAITTSFALEKERIVSDLVVHAACYKQMTHPSFKEQMLSLARLLEKAEAPLFDALIGEKECFLEKMEESNRKVRAKPLDEGALFYPGLVHALKESLFPLIQEAKDGKRLLLRLAADAQAAWDAASSKRGANTPDELLKKVESALHNPAFRERLRGRFEAVIIDEFQDTDPVQWRIAEHFERLYLVGDPKQSIYGFRRSDVYTYLKALSSFPEKRRAHLDTNYRSDPSLVAALNAFFSQSPSWMPLPALNSVIPYRAVKHPSGKENRPFHDGRGALHFFVARDALGKEKSWPTKGLEREVLFPRIAQEIAHLHREEGILYQEMAVLVKDRFQQERISAFLSSLAIPTALTQTQSITDSEHFLLMMEVLFACLHSDQASALKRALITPLFNCTAFELEDRAAVFEARTLFAELFRLWQKWGVAALFRHLFSLKTPFPVALAEEELFHLIATVANIERTLKAAPQRLYAYLQRLILGQEEEVVSSSCGGFGVQIMTQHKSKGLEFEVVFALGVATRHLWQEEFNSVEQIEEKEAEKKRLLYVALTRAKRRVYIPTLVDQEAKPVATGTASSLELFFEKAGVPLPLKEGELIPLFKRLQQEASLTFEELTKPLSLAPLPEPTEEAPSPSPPPLTFSSLPLLSFTSLAQKKEHLEALETPTATEKSLHTLPLGAKTGVLIHSLFEQVFARSLFSPFDKEAVRLLIQNELEETPLDGWNGVLLEMVEEALHLDLGLGFSLSHLKRGEALQEIPFAYADRGGVVKGFIDLAFTFEGKVYLLDWKSNYLGPNDAAYSDERLKKVVQESDYTLQAALYKEALRRVFEHHGSFKFGGAFYLFLRGKKVLRLF